MGTVLIEQLLELFPHIEEDFIRGLYDAYKEENPDLENMMDVVFSFEYPPIKKFANELGANDYEDLQHHSDNLSLDVSDITEGRSSIEDEVLVQPPIASNTDVTNIQIFQQNHNKCVHNSTSLKEEEFNEQNSLNEKSNRQESTSESSLDPMLTSSMPSTQLVLNGAIATCIKKSDTVLSNLEDVTEIDYEYPEKNSNDLIKSYVPIAEENNIHENQIKLLFFELPFRNDDDLQTEKIESQVNSANRNCKENTNQDNRITYQTNEFPSSEENFEPNPYQTAYYCKPTSSAHKVQPALDESSEDSLELVHKKETKTNDICVGMVSLAKAQLDVPDTKLLDSPFSSAESKYSLLSKVFPDADVKYLSGQCEEIADADQLLLFISKQIDDKMYPKKIESEEKTPEVLGFDCTIEEFLQYIPDPIAEFLSSQYIRTGYEENAEIYLTSRYQTLSEDFIKQQLLTNEYNLTKVCQELDSTGYEASAHGWKNIILHHSPSIFFHQEVWYIEHKAEIDDFLSNAIEAAKLEEELNKPSPPSVEEVFVCSICTDEIVEYSDLGSCDGPSGHLFCKTCIKRHVEVQMGEAKTSFTCLHNCGGLIHLQTIEDVLPPEAFNILMMKVGEEEIRKANIPGVEACPFCPYAYGPGEGTVFMCLNSACMKPSCRLCRKEQHNGVCEIFKYEDEEAARHFIENKMTEALVRNCYSCGKGIVKADGCNKMTCVCGAKMCYLCREPVQDYTHFNGRGGDNFERCELYSENETLHDLPVAATAKKAFEQLIANNPELKLDAAKIIPQ